MPSVHPLQARRAHVRPMNRGHPFRHASRSAGTPATSNGKESVQMYGAPESRTSASSFGASATLHVQNAPAESMGRLTQAAADQLLMYRRLVSDLDGMMDQFAQETGSTACAPIEVLMPLRMARSSPVAALAGASGRARPHQKNAPVLLFEITTNAPDARIRRALEAHVADGGGNHPGNTGGKSLIRRRGPRPARAETCPYTLCITN
jgi:hypothetical protein